MVDRSVGRSTIDVVERGVEVDGGEGKAVVRCTDARWDYVHRVPRKLGKQGVDGKAWHRDGLHEAQEFLGLRRVYKDGSRWEACDGTGVVEMCDRTEERFGDGGPPTSSDEGLEKAEAVGEEDLGCGSAGR